MIDKCKWCGANALEGRNTEIIKLRFSCGSWLDKGQYTNLSNQSTACMKVQLHIQQELLGEFNVWVKRLYVINANPKIQYEILTALQKVNDKAQALLARIREVRGKE